VIGPGDPTMCHCADERVAVTEVRDAALVLTKIAMDIVS
jgi:acetylornithine deacetylase/succinyl-diaminopimelate desuccinylase-like protein